ncbi:MAG: exopolysaccharide biosynthesis protein [bacterium]
MIEQASEYEKSFGETLDEVIDRLPPDSVTLETVMDLIGQDGLLIFCIFLTIPFLVPVSIPGVSTVFGLIILLIGISVMSNRRIWLPERLMKRSFPVVKLKPALEKGAIWVHRIEKFSHPRFRILTQGITLIRFNGLMLIIAALLLMAPFGFVPFSNTLPGLAILFLSLGILQQDGYCIMLGYVTIAATTIYFAFLLLGGAITAHRIIEVIRSSFP